jgi:hypothetical protein
VFFFTPRVAIPPVAFSQRCSGLAKSRCDKHRTRTVAQSLLPPWRRQRFDSHPSFIMGNGKFGLTDVPKSMRGDRRSPNSQFTGTWLALPARGLHEKERNATAENGFGFTGLFDTCCTPVCDFQDPLVAPGKKRTALKAYGGGANSDKRETLLATVPGVAGVDPPSEVSLACCTAVCDFPDDLHSWNKRTNAPDRHQGNSVLKNEAVLKRGGGKAAAAGELARDIQRLPYAPSQQPIRQRPRNYSANRARWVLSLDPGS